MFWAIWYHLYDFKKVKNTYGGVLPFSKSSTPPCVFFTFLKLYKYYQIAQRITLIEINEYILRKQNFTILPFKNRRYSKSSVLFLV